MSFLDRLRNFLWPASPPPPPDPEPFRLPSVVDLYGYLGVDDAD